MTPEVILLKIDQIAKRAIPITAKTEEKTKDKSSALAPKINEPISSAIKKRKTVKYLFISLIRASFIPLFRPNFQTAVLMINLMRNSMAIRMSELMSSLL